MVQVPAQLKELHLKFIKQTQIWYAIAGDIVYSQGSITDYKTKFWPRYNKDAADTLGAPLMRSYRLLQQLAIMMH
jgi:hypothetical protein